MSGKTDTAARRPRPARASAGRARRRRAAALLALTVAAVVALLGGASSPAWAHAVLERATPAGGTAVDTAPASVTLGFSESVQAGAGSIKVVDARGTRVDTGRARGGERSSEVTVDLKPGLPNGTYLVSWRVVSADSHPIAGGYAFGIGEAPAAGATAAASAAGGGSSATGFVFGVARLVAFAGIALLLGAGFFLATLWPGGLRRRAPRRLLVAGWVTAVVGAVACLLLQGPYTAGLGLSGLFRWDPLSATLTDRYGKLTLIRLLALLLAVPLLRALLTAGTTHRAGAADAGPAGVPGPPPASRAAGQSDPPRRSGISIWTRVELAGLAVAVAATTALTGHAGAGSWSWLAASSVTAHLLAMSVWLGGLAVLAAGVLERTAPATAAAPAQGDQTGWAAAVARGAGERAGRGDEARDGEEDEEAELAAARAYLDEQVVDVRPVPAEKAAELAAVLPRWSRAAMAAVAMIVLTGTYQTWREVGPVGALLDTEYGRLLLYKLWFVLAMLGLGMLAQRWVSRHYRPVALAMTQEADAARRGGPAGAGGGLGDGPDGSGTRPEATVGAVAGLRRGVLAEAVVGLVVLAVTAALVDRVPGRVSYAPPFHTTTTAGPLTVELRVTPTRVGLETVEVVVRDPQNQPQRLVEASVRMSLPSAQVGPLDVPMTAAGTGQLVTQEAQVPLPGDWQMTVTVRINDFDQYSTTVTYRVR
ncbi:copper resistance protein CopC [Frankia sp. CNm7]|uniref:Copper resistance protein CopC n=1 Tax=Frankia nepalensis TaxID=1836974 RepID=A0A937UN56_9ACTN|nr:copper resistance protein CopC [Frankia nepalensis]MBL7495363.1 copper resistance protein CopC [Frankia nepalensis]MBL7514479.1 copper resistance protein CopC [Frankia nepalensis]MBL7518573.1 copper resistance protein CopC [Frankia nepalensis]MBL7627748.1 copper resistance protein CopC [Frankia nepalensis]